MMIAYINGIDIGWVLLLFLLLFIVGGSIALVMLVIPKHYDLFFHKGYVFVISAFLSIASIVAFTVLSSKTLTVDELETGKHWKMDCSLKEVNVSTGTYTAPINRLDCAGIIIHVPTEIFNRYISEWAAVESKNKLKNDN